jgi:hypothetical protein
VRLRERFRALTASRVVREVRKRHLSYLGYDALSDLERAVRRLERRISTPTGTSR